MKAFILAAGLGTRLKPITNKLPKALVKLNGIPLLEIVIKKLIKYGFNEIIINVHHFANQIIEFLQLNNYFNTTIIISDERDLLLDTGGALKKASCLFNDNLPFLIHNVDVLSNINLRELFEYHTTQNSAVTIAVQKRISTRYFLFDHEKNLCGWKNVKSGETKIVRKPSGDLSEYAFSGIHIVNPSVFKNFPAKDVFSIIDFYLALASKNKITYYEHNENFFFDLGTIESLIKAEEFLTKSNFLEEII